MRGCRGSHWLLGACALAASMIGCSSEQMTLPTYDDDAGWTGCAATAIPSMGLVATLHETASTNSRSIEVSIYGDGSATRTLGPPTASEQALGVTELPQDPPPENFPPGTAEVEAVLRDLACIGHLSAIHITSCAKSISFGTKTTIEFAGETSGDLQCVDPSPRATGLVRAAQQLNQDCDALL